MNFPTYENPTDYPAQSVLDSTDLTAITNGVSLNGVVSGCAVTPRSPVVMGVAVGSGTIIVDGILYPVVGGNVSLSTASTGDRRDIIWVKEESGVVTVGSTTGTAAPVANWKFETRDTPPVKPDIPSNCLLLAEVYVVGTGYVSPTTAISTNEIVDKRVIIVPPSTVAYDSLIDNTNSGYIYVGEAAVGSATSASAWRISKITTGVSPTILYAGGGAFTQIWDNRASLVYA